MIEGDALLMQSFIGIPFALRNRKIFICVIIEIGAATHSFCSICFSPAYDVKIAVKFKSKFHASFMLDLPSQCRLIRIKDVR